MDPFPLLCHASSSHTCLNFLIDYHLQLTNGNFEHVCGTLRPYCQMRRHSQIKLKTIQSWKSKDLCRGHRRVATTRSGGMLSDGCRITSSMLPFTAVIYFALSSYIYRGGFFRPFQCASLAGMVFELLFSCHSRPPILLVRPFSRHFLQRPLQPSRSSPPFPQILMHIPHLLFIRGGLVTADSPPPSGNLSLSLGRIYL